eukprot:TRINITY_DN3948_c0_g1_i1.p1 TRINITY_DN3948_c0_g1~~TRINITY_DN3948_c0_g1_i1.p1  ORF type:complete len:680 (+),score=210.21 TRINITY_DN3948_c0_g1_i1:92-2131(+)
MDEEFDLQTVPALIWNNVTYKIPNRKIIGCPPLKKQNFTLIENMSGIINRGELVCILGGSGAGKSTMLDILAKRKTYGSIKGKIYHNGKVRKGKLETTVAGYVRQEDFHLGNLTVKQSLKYAADLRCSEMSNKQKEKKVEDILKALNLKHIQNNLVGDKMNRGISGGESRRLTIGMELLNDPSILFLDEPTSGLDYAATLSVIKLLKEIVVKNNTAGILTIHQPSADVFAIFDKCFILGKIPNQFGEQVYFGGVEKMNYYLEKIGFPIPLGDNPADHVLVITNPYANSELVEYDMEEGNIGYSSSSNDNFSDEDNIIDDINSSRFEGDVVEESDSNTTPKDLKGDDEKRRAEMKEQQTRKVIDSWKESEEVKDLQEKIEKSFEYCDNHKDEIKKATKKFKPTSPPYQLTVLIRRYWQQQSNNKAVPLVPVIILLIIGILIGSSFFQVGYDQQDIQNRVSLLFFLILTSFFIAQPFFEFISSRRILTTHERGASLYSSLVYWLSILINIIPLEVLKGLIFVTCVYWTTNLNDDVYRFGNFLLIYSILVVFMVSYSLMLGSVTPSAEAALGFSSIIFSCMTLFNGFLILEDKIPDYWLWLSYINPLRYVFKFSMMNEFRDVDFDCPSNSTCAYEEGKDLLDFYGADNYDLKYIYLLIVICFALFFSSLILFGLRFCKFEKR